jgi:hypothetical protein
MKSLREQYGRKSESFEEQSEPIIRFWLDGEGDTPGDCVAFPFFSLLAARLMPAKGAALFEFQMGNIVLQGPGVRALFESFCANKATNIRTDNKDILSVTLVLPTPPQPPTDPTEPE